MSKRTQGHKQNNDIEKSLTSHDLDKIYFNEFALGVSNNDMFILLRCNGREEAVLNLSHITAKSLAISLTKAIDNFEEQTNQRIIVPSEDE